MPTDGLESHPFFYPLIHEMPFIIPLELIELEAMNYHLAVSCRFDDGSEGLWIIDTGASRTVFDLGLVAHYDQVETDEELVKSAGIGAERLETTLGELHPFSLGEFRIEPLIVALIDLSHINRLYYHATEREICGLIGSDLLMQFNAVIDYRTLQLTLDPGPASNENASGS